MSSADDAPRNRRNLRTPSGLFHVVERREVGGYEVVASLGSGGAGEVFLALAEGPGGFRKLVVLKLLHPHFEEDPDVIEMFLDEARLAGRLEHSNIVQTLAVGLDEDRPFIAMTYLEGLPLDRILARFAAREERLPPTIAARIASEILAGLHYAHTLRDFDGSPLNIVHRDVSPANIYVCWDGSVRLLDFGIAKAATHRSHTDSGLVKGKFGYIAPEQALAEKVDCRADVWSAGVVLWEMLTGQRFLPQAQELSTLRKLIEGELPDLAEHLPDIDPDLKRCLDRALRRDLDARWESAQGMQQSLEQWLGRQPSLASREDIAATLGDVFAGEREQQQAMIRNHIGGLLAASSTGSFEVRPLPPPPRHRRPATATPAAPKLPIALALLALAVLGGLVATTPMGAPDVAAPPQQPATSRPGETATMNPSQTPEPPVSAQPAEATPPEVAASTEQEAATAMQPAAPPSVSMNTASMNTAPSTATGPTAPRRSAMQRATRSPATLTLDSVPWAEVWHRGRRLGNTPLVNLSLPPGTYVLELRNPEQNLETNYHIQLEAGETYARRITLR